MGRYIAGLLDALAPIEGLRARPLFAPGPAIAGMRDIVKQLPGAYALTEAARALALENERLRGMTVYHETNHAAPPFRGPVVVTVHDLSTVLHPGTQEPARARHFAKALRERAHKAARVIVPTQAIAREVVGHLGVEAARVRVIHHGVDARFTPGVTAPRQDFILYVGDAGPRKGLEMLKGLEFVHAGPPANYVSDDELLGLYREAAVLVLPSLYEGFGLPLVEAMACGTPCVASDDPALLEVSAGAALHVPRGDAAALRAAVERVLREPALRQELSEKGLQRARDFTWRSCAGQHAQVYREAAG